MTSRPRYLRGVHLVVRPDRSDGIARGIDKACEHGTTPPAIEARRDIVAEINGRTTIGNHTPSDCDNDGLPDFEIDASGAPVPTS